MGIYLLLLVYFDVMWCELFPAQLETSAVKVSGFSVSGGTNLSTVGFNRPECTAMDCTATRRVVVSIQVLTFPYRKLSSLDVANAVAIVIPLSTLMQNSLNSHSYKKELVKCKRRSQVDAK